MAVLELVKKPSIPRWAATKLTNAMGSCRKFEYRWSISSSIDKSAVGGCHLPSTIEDEQFVPPHRPTPTSRGSYSAQRSTTVQEEEQRAVLGVIDDQSQKLTRKSQSEGSTAARCLTDSHDSGSMVVGSDHHGRKFGANNVVQNFIIKIMCRKRSKSRGGAVSRSGEKDEELQQKQQNIKRSNNNNSENSLTKKNEFGLDEKVVVPTLVVQEDSTNFEIWRARQNDNSSIKNVDFNGSKSLSSESTDESLSLKTPLRIRDFDYHDQYRNRSSPDSSRSENQHYQDTTVIDLDLKIDKTDQRKSSKLIVDPKSLNLQPDQRRKSKSILKQFTLDFDNKLRSIV
uniref:Uncharacterized protein n=1 Tax=Romanomermis culicivorax TaxID=13658 RepID=A0A915IU90_ROMCU